MNVFAAETPRATEKLRSFLISAYNAAIAARFDRAADATLAAFNIKTNPAADVFRESRAAKGRPGARHLSPEDLGAFLRALAKH